MRVQDKGTRWSPNVSPSDAEELPKYLFNELTKLSKALFQVEGLHMDRMYKEPGKPRDGDLVLFAADVVDVSAGLYYYNGTAWVFIA